MATPFLGAISVYSFNFPPKGFAFCNGQILPINQNTALFSLLGTFYGGNGTSNFALPNLQSRTPIHQGNGIVIGQTGGSEAVTLTLGQLPLHAHKFAISNNPANALLADTSSIFGEGVNGPNSTPVNAYAPPPANTPLNAGVISNTGNNLPHNNIQPSLVLSFCIALNGIFPTRN